MCLSRDDGCCVLFPLSSCFLITGRIARGSFGVACFVNYQSCVCTCGGLVPVAVGSCCCWFLLLASTVGVALVGTASKCPTGLQAAALAIVLQVCSRGCGKGAFLWGGLAVVCSACRLGQCFARAFQQSTATPLCVCVCACFRGEGLQTGVDARFGAAASARARSSKHDCSRLSSSSGSSKHDCSRLSSSSVAREGVLGQRCSRGRCSEPASTVGVTCRAFGSGESALHKVCMFGATWFCLPM